jgi:TPR repeat protein
VGNDVLADAMRAYGERFGETPSLFQLPADEQEAARLIHLAIEKGDPEACYPALAGGGRLIGGV